MYSITLLKDPHYSLGHHVASNINLYQQLIYGVVYECHDCLPYRYVACKKCHGRIQESHRCSIGDERPHTFHILKGHEDEFEVSTPQSSRANSGSSRQYTALDDGVTVDEDQSPGLDDFGLQGDDIEMLDFPPSNDSGELGGH